MALGFRDFQGLRRLKTIVQTICNSIDRIPTLKPDFFLIRHADDFVRATYFLYVYIYIYTNIHTDVHTYIRIYIHTYIHTYIHRQRWFRAQVTGATFG